MINCTRIDARGYNKRNGNMFDYMLATERLSIDSAVAYYAGSGPDPRQTLNWGGSLAAELGLEGRPVTREVMEQLGKGFSPTGRPLCKNAGKEARLVIKTDRWGNVRLDDDGKPMEKWEGGHRVGFDLTISAPGDVSVAFALADEREKLAILEAHRQACAVAMRYIESKVETRRGEGGKEVIGTQGLVWTAADHVSNRNVQCDLHTHHLAFGVSKGEDGRWGTFDAIEIYRHRHAADHLYKAELYSAMKALGYGIQREHEVDVMGRETGQILTTIAGIDRELVLQAKTRRQEILDYVKEHPDASHDEACKATRKKKEEPPFEQVVKDWQQTFANIARERPDLVPTTQSLKQTQGQHLDPHTFDEVLQRMHENEAMFCEHDLVRELGMEFAGQKNAEEILNMVKEFTEQDDLVRVKAEHLHEDDRGIRLARKHREDRFCATWMVEWEAEIIRRSKERENETDLKLFRSTVDREIAAYEKRKGFTLTEEQKAATGHLTHGTAGVGVMSGLAGTGKTTVAEVYKQCFEAEGKQLMGLAVSGKAAAKLEEESGMPCMSVAKFFSQVRQGKVALTKRDVVVLDEAGMVATDDTLKLMTYCQGVGAKLVMQGDSDQLQPIAAGNGFELAKMALGDTKLTEIRRQKNAGDLITANSFYERDHQGKVKDMRRGHRSRQGTFDMGTEILNNLKQRNCIDDFGTDKQAIKALVDDYLKDKTPMDEKLVLAHTRSEVKALTTGIRTGLQKQGVLDKEEFTFRSIVKGQWEDLTLSRRDRVMFTATNNDLGVINGTEGTVESIRKDKSGGYDVVVRIEGSNPKENGRIVQFNTSEHNALAHRYAMTVHKAQGQGKSEVYHLATNMGMLDQQSALVAFTRLTKGSYRMYTTDEMMERMAERLGTERHKEMALSVGLSETQAAPVRNLVQDVEELLAGLKPQPQLPGMHVKQREMRLTR
ncbi:conjugal transfer protein TraA [Stenotrophomonas maltophilia]|uniref:MobF family relaxase n=1 Tax=Stenotrophomonas maltophilia TaxID=40324 RepID=UPI000D1A45CD|nr:conjugal transfer protein TraA [Stenotrophomonas maltophilia]MBA0411232.1 conjugal transfer protein TraA [Stenotrophomonas maltophilia]MBA0496334.1 conjugal transfer protein TraA [Stenotrophomonas maltophilia]MBA0500672.1 conjugal transfer protein TraA [Stenotrophomonas maltophilia]MBA0505769.1 conjugal transfer protein TraA [Stenotrophomonas maltophilia]